MKTLIARWETRGGKYWLELYKDESGYTYKQEHGGGNIGTLDSKIAMDTMERHISYSKMDGINLKRVK